MRLSRRAAALTALTVSVAVCLPALAAPPATPRHVPAGRLAFATAHWESTPTSTSLTVKGIGVVNLDGGARADLTAPPRPSHDHMPTWSPDGKFLAHMHEPGSSAPGEVRIVRADGRGRPVSVGQGFWPEFSPDGRWLAWVTGRTQQPGVELVPVDTSGEDVAVDRAAARFLPLPLHSFAPSWSPDGAALAVWVPREDDFRSPRDLFRLDVGTGELRQLSTGVGQSIGAVRASWHPLGSHLAFVAETPKNPGAPGAYVVAADGTSQRELMSTEGSRYYSSVVWSPDGLRLALQSNTYADGALVVTPTGQVVHRLGARELTQVTAPVFSPDGTHVLAMADAVGGPYRPNVFALSLVPPLAPRQLTRDQSVFPTTLTTVDPGLALRVFGATPAATARAVADRLRLSRQTVVLAAAGDEAVATPLAATLRAPLLLSGATGLPLETEAALRADVPTTAYVVGRLSPVVEMQLRLIGVSEVRSLTAHDPAAASARVAEHVPSTTAYLAPTSDRTAQSAAAAVAGALRAPLLLTDSGTLSRPTRSALAAAKTTSVVVVGTVSSAVLAELRDAGLRVLHVVADRNGDLSAATATHARGVGLSHSRPVVASTHEGSYGAALLAAIGRRVLLLQLGDGAQLRRFLQQHSKAVHGVDVVGGPGAVTPVVETMIERVAH